MPKKYHNKTAICTYSAIVLSVASFVIQFAYEGWTMKGLEPLFTPLGIVGILLFVGATVLFIWNLRREELTPEQWLEIRDRRRPDLSRLKDAIGEYTRRTFQLTIPTKNPALYCLESYSSGRKPTVSMLIRDTVVDGNKLYLRIKSEDEDLGAIRTELASLVSRQSSNKLDKMLHQLYRREHLARSYQIYLKNRRTYYPVVPLAEERMLNSDIVSVLAKYLKNIYSYISIMERGKDLE